MKLDLAGQNDLRKRTWSGPQRGNFPKDDKERNRGFLQQGKDEGPGVTCEAEIRDVLGSWSEQASDDSLALYSFE